MDKEKINYKRKTDISQRKWSMRLQRIATDMASTHHFPLYYPPGL